jgi:hypothetical protein
VSATWSGHNGMAQLPTWACSIRRCRAGVVERVDTAEKKVYVDRTNDQFEAAPDYDQTVDDAQHRERLGNYDSETYNTQDTRM